MLSNSNTNRFGSSLALIAVMSSFGLANFATASSERMNTLYDGAFTRVAAERDNGRSVAAHCQIGGLTSPDHWQDATAHLHLQQDGMTAEVTISVENARPDTLFTVWLMLNGGSPLMQTGATALIHSDEMAEAVALIDAPTSTVTNGFTTDADGHGSVTLALDYAIVGGAFPFQNYAGFNAENPIFTRENPTAVATAIANARDGVPFTLRLASHCGDNLHNGLVAGQHEPWFDWLAE